MGIEIAGLGGLILLGLAVWAIVNIVNSSASTGGKVLWTLFVLLLPPPIPSSPSVFGV